MDTDVFTAAREGNIDCLREHREHLHQMLTPSKNTVLHIYIACAKRIRTSSNNTANINTVAGILDMCPALLIQANDRGETTLHMASKHGHDHIVEHLINTARARQEEACYQLLIRSVNHDGDTALHEAVRFKHHTVVEILTRADPEALYPANDAGETPLYMAAQRGYTSLVSEILETCKNPSYEGPNGRTALHAAVIYNDQQLTSKLLDYFTSDRALTKAVDKQGWTPLHFAAFFGHSLIVKHLLRADKSAAYVRDKDDKKTALHIAASKGHLDALKELISHCPDCCELVDKRHQNVLHYAIQNKRFEIQDLVQKDPWLSNVLLNGKDENQNTPFHQLAAFHKVHYVSRAGSEIIDSSKDLINDARVDKMAFNKGNLTALDMIQANDTFSRLEKKYLQRLSSKVNSGRPGYHTVNNEIKGNNNSKEDIKIERRETTGEIVKELKQSHLIAATLIATVTFSAGMTMPGGYQSEKGQDQGLAILRGDPYFQQFIVTNSVAFILSSLAVFIHIWVILTAMYTPVVQIRWVLHLTIWALVFMMVAFGSGVWAVSRKPTVSFSAIIVIQDYLLYLVILIALLLNISTLNSTDVFYMFLVNIRMPTALRFCMFHLRRAKNKIRST